MEIGFRIEQFNHTFQLVESAHGKIPYCYASAVVYLHGDDFRYTLVLQNCHQYYYKDYGLPTDKVIVYKDSDTIMRTIYNLSEDFEASELNAIYDTNFTYDEIMAIRCAIHDSVNAVQALVNERIAEYKLTLVSED
jgi:hypothetical protein